MMMSWSPFSFWNLISGTDLYIYYFTKITSGTLFFLEFSPTFHFFHKMTACSIIMLETQFYVTIFPMTVYNLVRIC